MGHTAILGGTGPEGMGLALRLALCGDEIVIGSRRAERAAAAAAKAVQRLGDAGGAANVRGAENAAAVDGAEVVVLAFPYAGVAETVPPLAAQLAGKLVIDVVNPLVLKNGVFRVEPPPAGSAAEEIQRLLPDSRVVGAFKNESAEELQRIEAPLRGDVLVCGADPHARAEVMQLAGRIADVRPVDAGSLINARFLEGITALLLNLNRRHHAVTSIQILGLRAGAPRRS